VFCRYRARPFGGGGRGRERGDGPPPPRASWTAPSHLSRAHLIITKIRRDGPPLMRTPRVAAGPHPRQGGPSFNHLACVEETRNAANMMSRHRIAIVYRLSCHKRHELALNPRGGPGSGVDPPCLGAHSGGANPRIRRLTGPSPQTKVSEKHPFPPKDCVVFQRAQGERERSPPPNGTLAWREPPTPQCRPVRACPPDRGRLSGRW